MKKILRALAATAGFLLAGLPLSAQTIIGITSTDKIFSMPDPLVPSVITVPVPVTGLGSGQTIAGADFRPYNGQLYLLGYNSSNGASQLYTVDYTTGVATPVNTVPVTLNLGTGPVGFDFNPVADRIRVTGANRMNYRLVPATGAIAATDSLLRYATGDSNAARAPKVAAIAYTNNYIGSEATTLYDYDEALNVLSIQASPNNGVLHTVDTSNIVVDTSSHRIDMDIAFDPASLTNRAYLAGDTGAGRDMLYSLDLSTGAVTSLGFIGDTIIVEVKNIAVRIDRSLPAVPNGQVIYALTKAARNLISFDSNNPTLLRDLQAITGITPGQVLVGMDFRPADQLLYALGYDTANGSHQLYRLELNTGAATAINSSPATGLALGNGTNTGFDFNPVADRIRVVSSNGNSYRLDPATGLVAATDTALAFAAGDANAGSPVRVGSIAYLNSYPNAASTTLYGLDDSLGVLVRIAPPNAGVVNTVALFPGLVNPADYTTDIDFYYDSVSMANLGYLTANSGGSSDRLFAFTTAGSLTPKGIIGMGIAITDIAVRPDYRGTLHNAVFNAPAVVVVTIWPNPVTDALQIRLPVSSGTMEISWIDMSGKLVQQEQLQLDSGTATADASQLPPGAYTILIRAGGRSFGRMKIIKQ